MKKNVPIWLLFFLCYGQCQLGLSQTYECDDHFYLGLSTGVFQPSNLYQLNTGVPFGDNAFDLLEDNYGKPFNCIGYNVQDKMIYGLNPYDYHLYRINAFGEITDLGIPANLDTVNYEYFSGAFNPQGNRLTVIGRDKSDGMDKLFYSIRFDRDDYAAGLLTLNSENGSAIEDLAYDPVYGDIYGWDGLHKRLVTLDLGSGGVVTYEATTLGSINSLGSLFFDDKGVLYGYGSQSNEENTLFKFDKFTRTILETYSGPPGAFSDGCACPYRIRFFKKPSTHQVVPCSEFTMTYLIHNTAGSSYTQKVLIDSFPEHFTISEIIRPPIYGEIESGIGTNKIQVSGMDVLLGRDSIVINVEVGPEASGNFTSHAILDGFPLALGKTILSDAIFASEAIEPTTLQVLSPDLLLNEEITYICDDAVLEFGTVELDLTYLWSDGSTSPTIEITDPGLYWVEISNDCVTMRDSIIVAQVEEPLNLELGENLEMDIGESLALLFTTNASTAIWAEWEAAAESFLSCTECLNPSYTPTASGVVRLTIGDEYGCIATDEIAITVNKEFDIYVANIFSPNEDGSNDLFFIQGKLDFELIDFTVYNRWGSPVHSATSGVLNSWDHAWDGRCKGNLAPEGVYLWIASVQLPDGTVKRLSGDISLVR